MKKFSVRFWYYTDLRDEWEGDAANEFAALALALQHCQCDSWATSRGFKVEIESA